MRSYSYILYDNQLSRATWEKTTLIEPHRFWPPKGARFDLYVGDDPNLTIDRIKELLAEDEATRLQVNARYYESSGITV